THKWRRDGLGRHRPACGQLFAGGTQLVVINFDEGRVLDAAQAVANLFSVFNATERDVSAPEPEQRQVCDDAVRVGLEKIVEYRSRLFIAPVVVELLPTTEHGLFDVRGRVLTLWGGAGHDSGANGQARRAE